MKILKGIGYWIAQLTWGCVMTIPGLFVALFVMIFFKGKPHKNGYSFIIEVGGNWGGINLGAISLCGSYSQVDGPCFDLDWYEHTRRHEFGHSLQNIIFGPLQLFVVGIPSFIRCNFMTYEYYDAIWFEYTASKWGHSVVNTIENTDVQYNFGE